MESSTINIEVQKIRQLLENVSDPEIPVLSVTDLGVVRDIHVNNNNVEIFITPTYSGCPAMDMISMNIKLELLAHGYKNMKVTQVLSPAWTTDWISENGKKKLKDYGIAPPEGKSFDKTSLENLKVECPHCGSSNTKPISEFGSTSCKALFQCTDCGEPFDYFKCH
ncbi:MAG TPA: 1,2-phenylacetyl-CoA epoxidase subunit PaaD [Chitinophagaceae bacterium]|nr:1,2-phenylacetyl-CoA epoxidase subunit PaaD [Chitinophagaceae bacterium]